MGASGTTMSWSRRLLACVAATVFATVAGAQTTGTIVGTVTDAHTRAPVAGALVIATSPGLQGEQTALTDSAGRFTLTLLPPGRYRLAGRLEGYKPADRAGLALQVDYTLRANLVLEPEAVTLEPQVIETRVAPVVNIGTAEDGAVISREFLATVPTTRDYEGTILVVPTALRDAGGIGLGGATSPENNYILDGFRVGEPSFNSLGTNLLTNFIGQVDVKTGGFLPEYGYSSGGIVNTVTRSGSNEFHGSIWGNLTPGLFTPGSETVGGNGQAIASYASPYKGSYDADFGLEVGGPILKDKLWFYAGLAARLVYDARTGFYRSRVPSKADPSVSEIDPNGMVVMQQVPGTETVYGRGMDKLFGLAKLNWLASENHSLFLSFNTQPSASYGRFDLGGSVSAASGKGESNVTNTIVGYGGKFLDKHLLVEANLGWYDSWGRPVPVTMNGVDQAQTPRIIWNTLQPLQNFVPSMATACPYESRQAGIGLSPGCYVSNYATGGYGFLEWTSTTRLAGTASLTALFDLAGQHVLKGGVQIDYARYRASGGYSAAALYLARGRFLGPGVPGTGGGRPDAFMMRTIGQVDPASAFDDPDWGTSYANWCTSLTADGQCVNPGGKDPSQVLSLSTQSNNWSNGYYLQDSWTIANVLTLGFGVRLDTQAMNDASTGRLVDMPSISVSDSWAPRVQAVWDFTGQGRGKIQANWGRYYEAFPLAIANNLFAPISWLQGNYQLSSCSAAMIPGPSSRGNPAVDCPNVYGLEAGQGPGPNTRTLGASNIPPGFSATWPGGTPVAPDLKGQYTDQFGGGIQYEVLQDLSIGLDYLGRRQGNVVEDMAQSFIANPARSQPWTVTSGPYQDQIFNPRNAGNVSPGTGVVYTVAFPAPVRSYDAVTLSVNKLFSKRWLAMASYTWSSLRGNYSGLVNTFMDQFIPNISNEYDSVSGLGNRSGPLGGDRTHQVKAAGSYLLTLDESLSFTPGAQLSAISGAPANIWGSDPPYGDDAFLVLRGMAGNLPWLVSLDLSAKLTWALGGPYALSFTVSVFNVLDAKAATQVDQRYTYDWMSPMQGAQCRSKNAISQSDPLTAILADCPDLAYARTIDGSRASPNLNYGRATSYQVPVSARFGVALSF
jgi:outer membrane receptor protein involved in Fe transport